ncbi:MAG: DUF1761 domain-containing protein [Bdellovibrionia bacterium]
MQEPQLIINYPAILVSVVACMVFGFLWYGPLLGRTWAKGMGMNMDKKPDPGVMKKALLLQALGLLLMTYVLAHAIQVWRPSVWGVGQDGPDGLYGLMAAIFTCLGYYIPQQLSKVAWEGRPWVVFFINVGHDFINLLIAGEILSYWR